MLEVAKSTTIAIARAVIKDVFISAPGPRSHSFAWVVGVSIVYTCRKTPS